jgi:hypothetical protein
MEMPAGSGAQSVALVDIVMVADLFPVDCGLKTALPLADALAFTVRLLGLA